MNTSAQSRLLALISGPLAFVLILLLVPGHFISASANETLAVATWMILWWVLEAVPVPVTALLPLVLFPFMGVMKIDEAAAPYANPIIFLFMGGFLIAIALEKHRLHERIALSLIRITGTSGNGIIMGFMMATGFLSMWISNTATAMMMMPIALSVINLINPSDTLFANLGRNEKNFALGLMLTVGYAATLGGLATLIGTPPNVVFKGLLETKYDQRISFSEWIIVGLPVSILLLTSTYIIITRVLFPNHMKNVKGSDTLINDKLSTLGPVSGTEKKVMAVFLMTSLLWIFQEPLNSLVFRAMLDMQGSLLNDSNIAMIGGILMFVIPADTKRMEFILDWRDTKHLQWGILILFGGGLCLAQGLQNSGIIQAVGNWIADKSTFGTMLILILIVAAVALSEVMSNVALVQIFVPVVFGIADGLHVNPILLAMPVTMGASIAFMLPIGTPPNAIVFSSGYIRMIDMVKAGFLLNLVSIIILLLCSTTIVQWVFS